jgi:hypothetical protein
MVFFFGRGEYSFVQMRNLSLFGSGVEHEKFCRSSKSQLFKESLSAAMHEHSGSYSQCCKNLLLDAGSKTPNETKSSIATDSETIVDAGDEPEGDTSVENEPGESGSNHYERLREENMRRNKEILKVVFSWAV